MALTPEAASSVTFRTVPLQGGQHRDPRVPVARECSVFKFGRDVASNEADRPAEDGMLMRTNYVLIDYENCSQSCWRRSTRSTFGSSCSSVPTSRR